MNALIKQVFVVYVEIVHAFRIHVFVFGTDINDAVSDDTVSEEEHRMFPTTRHPLINASEPTRRNDVFVSERLPIVPTTKHVFMIEELIEEDEILTD